MTRLPYVLDDPKAGQCRCGSTPLPGSPYCSACEAEIVRRAHPELRRAEILEQALKLEAALMAKGQAALSSAIHDGVRQLAHRVAQKWRDRLDPDEERRRRWAARP